MFLFLLLTLLVVWAKCLADWAPKARWTDDCQRLAQSWGALPVGPCFAWMQVPAQWRGLALAPGYCLTVPKDGASLPSRSDAVAVELSWQEFSAGLMGPCGCTSWCNEQYVCRPGSDRSLSSAVFS